MSSGLSVDNEGGWHSNHITMHHSLAADTDPRLAALHTHRYSAALALHGAYLAPYYLDEDSNWGLSVPHLREQAQQVQPPGPHPPATTLRRSPPGISLEDSG